LHQGLRLSRLWLALVLVAFCLPLFIGLGRPDLETDEAIYSFAVDRILEVGDWLEPKSSPSETVVFLEKPPLKFWMVAAPIKAGLLPHDEFGLRFLDALAGGASFVYVFALGSLLAGPVCGAVAVLLLFVHGPLLFEHGLRTNNMEAMLLLSYCGGVFHFLRWSAVDETRVRRRHAFWAALFFILGFMTKFVAALFLPFTLGLAALAAPRVRRRLLQDWRTWLGAAALVVALCAPWFIYAHVRFGSLLWETMLGEHVLRRFTGTLIPSHLQPWDYYLQAMWAEFTADRVTWLVAAGVVTLLLQAVRRRWFEGAVVLLWAAVPLAIISSGTSKLYHYAYPYLPPLTLAAGYLVALVVMLAPVPLRKLFETTEDVVDRVAPAFAAWSRSGIARRVASVLIVLAAAVAIGDLAVGGLRIVIDGRTVFRSAGLWRPLMLILLLALATGTLARVPRLVIALVVFSLMPSAAYRGQFHRLSEGKHPIRDAAACLVQLEQGMDSRAGLFLDIPEGIWHPLYYNFRRVQPLTISSAPLDPAIERHLYDPASARPLLLSDAVWQEWLRAHGGRLALPGAVAPPIVPFLDTVLLLPGPYAACSQESRLLTPR
jgi:4-amino-4-deoxy-L-arabinose transferase-like glycosyltransferase